MKMTRNLFNDIKKALGQDQYGNDRTWHAGANEIGMLVCTGCHYNTSFRLDQVDRMLFVLANSVHRDECRHPEGCFGKKEATLVAKILIHHQAAQRMATGEAIGNSLA